MQNRQYITITHYKEREFYFLNHAIQTEDGFIAKEIEQFHESEKEKFIEHIRLLQFKYPNIQIASISLATNQTITDAEDKYKVSAKIFNNNYVVQDQMDIGNIPTTLYFSPFSILYQEYKNKLDNKLTLLIGYFDRKLYMMFATEDKIHQSWIIGTRGLSEKQIAIRVYKSMKAYYKISYKFADHIEMLLTDDSPKLLKVLREELSLTILPTQKSIHNLLHYMSGDKSRAVSSYIRSSFVGDNRSSQSRSSKELEENEFLSVKGEGVENLEDLKLENSSNYNASAVKSDVSFFNKIKILFFNKNDPKPMVRNTLLSFVPFFLILGMGSYYMMENKKILEEMEITNSQLYSQLSHVLLATTSNDIFLSMGKSAELQKATISNSNITLKGVVWGIEPLRNSLNDLYPDGEFIIKPLENFMTEFSFKSKI